EKASRGDGVAVVRDDDFAAFANARARHIGSAETAIVGVKSGGEEERRDTNKFFHERDHNASTRGTISTMYDVAMKLIRCLAAISLLALGCGATRLLPHRTPPVTNEIIFTGSIVAAGDSQSPRANYAIYVGDGIVRQVDEASLVRKKHPKARVVDVSGATILPGLTDAHGHLYGLGLKLDVVDLTETQSMDEIVARTKQRADKAAAGEWIQGRGWDQND